MTPNHSQPERRSATRIEPKGSLQLKLDGGVRHARIGNISRLGVFALTDEAPDGGLVGRDVEVDLRLDMPDARWLTLPARVMRVDPAGVALAFGAAPQAFIDLLVTTSRASNRHHRVLSVVLVDASRERRQKVAEAFRTVGCEVVDVDTPLAAVVELGGAEFEPDLIAIADSVPSATSDELRRFVEQAHPHARMVTIGEGDGAQHDLRRWLSAAPEELLMRIRELLARAP